MTHEFRHAGFSLPWGDPKCDLCGVRKSKHLAAMLQTILAARRRDDDYGTVVTSDEDVSRLLSIPLSDDPPDPSVKAWLTGQSFETKNPASTDDAHYPHPLTAASDAAANMLTQASEAMAHPTETHHSAGGGGSGGYDNSAPSSYDSGSSSSYDSSSSSSSSDSGSSSSE